MPKVSVIIPTCNRAHFLRSAIESVVKQTFQDFEIFVVDDASSDESPALMRTLTDPRIRYLRHERKKGQGATRNAGIRHAAGEYIALLDDDDEWLPEKLEKQVAVLDRCAPETGLVYTGFRQIDARTGEIIGQVIPQKRGNLSDQMGIRNWVGTCSTVLLRRSCLESTGLFDEQLASGADYDLWIRISQKCLFEYIENPLVNYYVHDNNLTKKYEIIVGGMETTNRKHEHLFALHRKAYSERYHCLGTFYCLAGDVGKGKEAFLKAIKLYPFDLRYYFRLSTCLFGAESFRKTNEFKERLKLWIRGVANRNGHI